MTSFLRRPLVSFLLLLPLIGEAQSNLFSNTFETPASEPIDWLGDEFEDARSLGQFEQIWLREHWPFDSLDVRSINQGVPGHLLLIPRSSGWWEDYRAELTYKELSGNFVATTLVRPRNRVGQNPGASAPGSSQGGQPETEYSLGGLMVRAPRRNVEQDNAQWQRGHEAYVFLSMGAADLPGRFQFEDKTTRANPFPPNPSQSTRLITDAAAQTDAAHLRLIRIGPHMLLLVQELSSQAAPLPWRVLRRFHRPDLPEQVQLGFVAYTDWATMRWCSYEHHNRNVLTQSCDNPPQAADPDLAVSFDYFRLDRPNLAAAELTLDWSNPGAISDTQILTTFGFTP